MTPKDSIEQIVSDLESTISKLCLLKLDFTDDETAFERLEGAVDLIEIARLDLRQVVKEGVVNDE